MEIRDSIYLPVEANGVWDLDDDCAGLSTGNPEMSQITGRNLRGLEMAAAGDTVTGTILVPRWVDPTHNLKARIHYISGSSTAADTLDWILLLNFVAADAQIANPSGVLDTAIAQDTIGVAASYLNKMTAWGTKNANFLTRAQVEGGAKAVFSVELDAADVDLAAEKVWFLGLEFLYAWQNWQGDPITADMEESSILS